MKNPLLLKKYEYGSPTFDVDDDDTSPPSFSNLRVTDSIYDDSSNDFYLRADVSDPSGVSSVKFRYQFAGGTWSPWYSYEGKDGDTYEYCIPRSVWIDHIGESISWEVQATDDDYDGWSGDRSTGTRPTQSDPEADFKDDDTSSPSIWDVTVSEYQGDGDGVIEDDEQIKIEWKTDDSSGIYDTYLVKEGAGNPEPLYDDDGDTYYYSFIGALTPGAHDYYIYSRDNDNDRSGDQEISYYDEGDDSQMEINVNDDDTTPPSSSNLRVEDMSGNTEIEADEEFRFLVDLSDPEGISSAEIRYDTDGSLSDDYTSLSLSLEGGGAYSTNYIGPLPAGDVVWAVYATDGDSDWANDECSGYASSTQTLSITKEDTIVSDPSLTGNYSDLAEVTALLTDEEGNGISDRTLYFEYTEDSQWHTLGSGATNQSGYASVSVGLSMEPGAYDLRARFTGDSYYMENQAVGMLTVEKEATSIESLSASSSLVNYSDPLELLARFVDNEGEAIGGKTLSFEYFNGSWGVITTIETNSTGYASIETVCTLLPGDYELRTRFSGTAYYTDATSSAKTLTVRKEETRLSDPSCSGNYTDTVLLTTAITDNEGTPLSGENVSFLVSYEGSWHEIGSDTSNGTGFGEVNYSLTLSPGEYPLKATFLGNARYTITSLLGTLTIKREDIILSDPSAYIGYGDTFNITVRLTDNEGEPIAGRTIRFNLSSQDISATNTTNSEGYATWYRSQSLEFGTYNISASFAGDSYYLSYNSSGTLGVGREITLLTDPSAPIIYNQSASLVSCLTDDEGNALGEFNVTFALHYNGSWHSMGWNLTNSSGFAEVTISPSLNPGEYTLRVNYQGSTNYKSSETLGSLKIEKIPTALLDPSTSATYSDRATLFTCLTDFKEEPLTSRNITFALYYNGSWHNIGWDLTNETGEVALIHIISLPADTYDLRVNFMGTTYYNSTQLIGELTVTREGVILTDPSSSLTYTDLGTISLRVTDDEQNALSDFSIGLFYYNGSSWILVKEDTTDEAGNLSVAWAPDIPSGTYQLKAIWEGNEYYQAKEKTGILTINKEAIDPSRFLIQANSSSVEWSDEVNVTLTVYDDDGQAVRGVPIYLQAFNGSWRNITALSPDGTSFYMWEVTEYFPGGTVELKGSILSNKYYLTAETQRISLSIEHEKLVVWLRDWNVTYGKPSELTLTTLDNDGEGVLEEAKDHLLLQVLCEEEWRNASKTLLQGREATLTYPFGSDLLAGEYDMRIKLLSTYRFTSTSKTNATLIIIDATKPSVSITSPQNQTVLDRTSVTVKWNGSDEGSGIAHYNISINGRDWISVGNATSYELTGLSDGSYRIKVKAMDLVGNENEDTVSFKVDTKPPSVSVTSPEEGGTIKKSTATVEWTGTDNIGIHHYEIQLDGKGWENINKTSYTFADLGDGKHTVAVKAVDFAGHTAEDSISFTVNTSPIGGPGMMEEITIGIGVAIVVVAVAIYFLKKGKAPQVTVRDKDKIRL